MKLLIIIPAYKEEEAIVNTLESLADLPGKFDVVVVNDGSDDATADRVATYAAAHRNVRLLNLPVSIRKMVEAGELTQGHARALLTIEDSVRAAELAPPPPLTGCRRLPLSRWPA